MTGGHCCFNVYFALVWGAVDLVVPAAIVLIVLATIDAVNDVEANAVTVAWMGALALVFVLVLALLVIK